MSMYDFILRTMGIPRDDSGSFGFRNPPWGDEEDEEDAQLDEIFGMAEAMTRQMNEMMNGFQFSFGRGIFDGFGQLAPPSQHFLEERVPNHRYSQHQYEHPRDRYIKPSFEEPGGAKVDKDIDGQIQGHEIFDGTANNDRVGQFSQPPQTRFFGQSVTSKIIRGLDGRVKTEKSVQRSDGVKEVTVTRTVGDQTYSITTITKPDGTSEQNENFVNMDEANLPDFERLWSGEIHPALPPSHPSSSVLIREPLQDNSSWKNFFKWFK